MQRLANQVQRNNPPFVTGQDRPSSGFRVYAGPQFMPSGGGRTSRGTDAGIATSALLGAQARQRAVAEEGDIATWEADMALEEARARSRSYGGGGRRPVGGGSHRNYYAGRNRWVSGSGAGGLAAANIRAAANARRQASQANLRSNLGLASLQGYLAS